MIFAFNFLAIISIAYISGLSADFVPDAKVKCANNGVGYSDTKGSFFCKCAPNFTGKQCEIYQTTTCAPVQQCNPCAVSPCQNGMCQNVNCQAVCSCWPGYYGQFCQYQTTTTCAPTTTTTTCAPTTTPCNPCQYNMCQNGGYCQNGNNCQAVCQCRPGYYGQFCQYQVTTTTTTCAPTTTPCNPCQYNMCQNGGYCQNGNNCQAVCQCRPGYYGQFCQYQVTTTTTTCAPTTTPCNPCQYSPCQNGVCQNGQNCQAMCSCYQGFYGQFCQYQVTTPATTTCAPTQTTTYCPPTQPPVTNPCAMSPCAYGTCVNNGYGQAACVCYPGFSGPLCNICINYQVARAYLQQKHINKPLP